MNRITAGSVFTGCPSGVNSRTTGLGNRLWFAPVPASTSRDAPVAAKTGGTADVANAGVRTEETPDPNPVKIGVSDTIPAAVIPVVDAVVAAVVAVKEPLFLLLVINISTGSYPTCSTVKVNSDLRDN